MINKFTKIRAIVLGICIFITTEGAGNLRMMFDKSQSQTHAYAKLVTLYEKRLFQIKCEKLSNNELDTKIVELKEFLKQNQQNLNSKSKINWSLLLVAMSSLLVGLSFALEKFLCSKRAKE